MMNKHSDYDDIHCNGMNYVLKCINNHVISIMGCMLSLTKPILLLFKLSPFNKKSTLGNSQYFLPLHIFFLEYLDLEVFYTLFYTY